MWQNVVSGIKYSILHIYHFREARSQRNKNPFRMMGESTESSKNPFDEGGEEEMNHDSDANCSGGKRGSLAMSARQKRTSEGGKSETLTTSASTESIEDVDLLDVELPEWLQELSDDLEVGMGLGNFLERTIQTLPF